MAIAKNDVVTMNYTLKDQEGRVIDTTEGGQPFSYLHGVGSIIPGLEEALEGKSPGEQVSVSIPPEQAYGERNEAFIQVVPKDRFEGVEDVEVGMQFQTPTESGDVRIVTVIAVEGENVTIDANHPLAGVTLNFDVTVLDVRPATPEELSHGHVHGPEGHG
ncbi:MAG: peptidylprolyl isomerase [Gammaproteobacteria bacterium]|nr:MAG: peptidylprolyl isomerase [Gammaproteobacteria bacterium]